MDSINKFDDFLNCPSEFEELMKVREYRHQAYKQWLSVVKEIEALKAQLAEAQVSLANCCENVSDLEYKLAERDELLAKKDDALCSAFETVRELTKDKNNPMALCIQVTKLQEALALKVKEGE